ncbi:MAG TPA: type IV secretion system protein [Steroidobacteraceae bacterium]|jgi:type IV secretion system protein VirB6|nr:type IV secretion system protein [Steroidobacteraceae bacterium]
MGFFATFSSWLDAQLSSYIGNNTARLSAALEPAAVTLGTVYVMVWGYLQLTGKIEEPFMTGLRRIMLLVIVLGGALQLWLYNAVIVDTFYNAPAQLAAAVAGAATPVSTLDVVWQAGGTVASQLWTRAGLFNGDFGFYIAGVLVWIVMGLVCCYAMFLIALSKIALAVLLALGPLFILFRLFEGTRRLFDAWLMQLANYGFITILTVLLGALLLSLIQSYATQTAARGAALATVDALDMLLVAVIVLLVLRQIMPIAASLAGGGSLTTMGTWSRGVGGFLRSLPSRIIR